MFTLAQTKDTHDIVIDADGLLSLSYDKEAYANIIADCVRTLRGELQLDVEAGIPYMETVFESIANLTQWKAAVRRKVNSLPFVSSIISFDADVIGDGASKKVVFTMNVYTDEGTVEVQNV